ncbi:MAG: phosphoribosylglycinamide formyltransferase [Gammaproteobacteria bacterium]
MEQTSPASPLRVVVLISGNGSNLQAIIDKIAADNIPAEVVAVISNKADAYGLTRARNAGIDVEVIEHTDHDDRLSFDESLKEKIDYYQADLVVLAGFMRILTDDFVNHYAGRMINIHPSLLPRYQGLNTHQRVLDAKDTVHGASVHFVTPELDGGPVILQASVPIKENDTAESLAQRVHQVEHKIYPQVVKWFAEHRLQLDGDTVLFDNQEMTQQQKSWSG